MKVQIIRSLFANIVALLFSLWVSSAGAQTTFTYAKGTPTTFANGHYLSGTMTVDLSRTPARLNAANLTVYDSSDVQQVNFVQTDQIGIGLYSSMICGTTRSFYEVAFRKSGYTFYLDFERSNATSPIPGISGVHTSLILPPGSAASIPLSDTCSNYNANASGNNAVAAVPTLSEWAVIFLAAFVGLCAFMRLRRR